MSEELLKIDRLPTISDLRFLLSEVLGQDRAVGWSDLSSICRSRSVDLAFSFENAVKLLSMISLVDIGDDKSVRSRLSEEEKNNSRGDHSFCLLITRRLIKEIEKSGLLLILFNRETVKVDVFRDSLALHISLIPLNYPMIRVYLLCMGIAYSEKGVNGKIIINSIYKQFFIDEILSRTMNVSEDLDIDENSIKGSDHLKGINVFLSYSHKDEGLKEDLTNHMSGLRRIGLITDWNDRMILPGQDWDDTIKKKLEEADIIIFLISADFMASDYINDVEIARAIERHNQSLTTIVPIIARACDFESLPLSKFQALPEDLKAITSWPNKDEAFSHIVERFKKLIH